VAYAGSRSAGGPFFKWFSSVPYRFFFPLRFSFFAAGHRSGPSGKAAKGSQAREKMSLCVYHSFFFRAHSQKAEFYSLSATR